jgi:hypothetical protein
VYQQDSDSAQQVTALGTGASGCVATEAQTIQHNPQLVPVGCQTVQVLELVIPYMPNTKALIRLSVVSTLHNKQVRETLRQHVSTLLPLAACDCTIKLGMAPLEWACRTTGPAVIGTTHTSYQLLCLGASFLDQRMPNFVKLLRITDAVLTAE